MLDRSLLRVAVHAVLVSANLGHQTRLEAQKRIERQVLRADKPARAARMSGGDFVQVAAADQKRARKAARRLAIGH